MDNNAVSWRTSNPSSRQQLTGALRRSSLRSAGTSAVLPAANLPTNNTISTYYTNYHS